MVLSFSLLFSTTTDETKLKVLNRVYCTKKPIFVPAEEVSSTILTSRYIPTTLYSIRSRRLQAALFLSLRILSSNVKPILETLENCSNSFDLHVGKSDIYPGGTLGIRDWCSLQGEMSLKCLDRDIWRHLETFGDIWRHLETFGDIQRHLETLGNWK